VRSDPTIPSYNPPIYPTVDWYLKKVSAQLRPLVLLATTLPPLGLSDTDPSYLQLEAIQSPGYLPIISPPTAKDHPSTPPAPIRPILVPEGTPQVKPKLQLSV